MKIKNLIISAIATLTILGSCIQELRKDDFNDEAISGLIKISVKMPDGYTEFTTEGMKVTLTDNSTGLVYTTTVNDTGYAEARVAYGTYSVSAESKFNSGNVINIFNGIASGLKVTPNSNNASTTITLKHSRSSQIVIKELYYGGCKNLTSGKNYTSKDQYFILYNNSDEVAYLDSLCVGTAYPWNAPTKGKTADFTDPKTGKLLDGVPCSGIGWMFDGKGKDIPLQPGEQVVVSINAIDHTKITANSVNLGVEGYYVLYDPILTPKQSVPEAGTILLKGFWKTGTSTQYVISISSPTLFIFRMGGRSAEQFIADTYTKNPKTPNSVLSHCLLVETKNVIDGIECFRNNSDSKRLVSEVDNGFICIPNSGQGYSVHRKIDEEATAAAGGRIVYQDTNNSSNDFYVKENASLTGK